ncbi:MAG: helix-turn-helix transcriptional regulator [Chlorobium sp.]|nr:helix-turn-helix transcriptional regulator [Chlorobium sp.]
MKGPISTTVAVPPVKAGITFKDVGKVLSEQRKRIGLNQGDIAKQLKYVNINFISMLESGKSKIPVNKIDELVAAYQLPPEFILVAFQAEYPEYLGTMLRLAKKTPLIFKDVVNDPTARIDRIYQMTLDSLRAH